MASKEDQERLIRTVLGVSAVVATSLLAFREIRKARRTPEQRAAEIISQYQEAKEQGRLPDILIPIRGKNPTRVAELLARKDSSWIVRLGDDGFTEQAERQAKLPGVLLQARDSQIPKRTHTEIITQYFLVGSNHFYSNSERDLSYQF